MRLGAVEDRSGAKSTWDWKAEYVERLANEEGLEMFSEASVTPDTMLLLAGPPRIPDDGFQETLSPIGLVSDVTFNSDNSLRPMWEIGTDQTYFTRGKTSYQLSIGAMVANKPSLMKVMTRQSPIQEYDEVDGRYPSAPDHVGQFWTNMDTEYTAAPFGILMIFKTKGCQNTDDNGDFVSAMYLENCNIGNFSFNMNSQAVILQENVNIMFDRMIAVDYS